MSDVVPQCFECKYYPCKWYSNEEQLHFCSSLDDCPRYKEANFIPELNKKINKILEE